MINGNPEEFIESIYSCQDVVFIYKGEKYWYQGYMPDDVVWKVHMECYRMSDGKYIWQYDGQSIREGQKSFETSPIFDGKTFWEVEKEIEWVDC